LDANPRQSFFNILEKRHMHPLLYVGLQPWKFNCTYQSAQ
jgi:hypothetical protein